MSKHLAQLKAFLDEALCGLSPAIVRTEARSHQRRRR